MRLEMHTGKGKDRKLIGAWVAKTRRGFNKKQRKEILAARLKQIGLENVVRM